MIIVSQDKKTVVISEHIVSIRILTFAKTDFNFESDSNIKIVVMSENGVIITLGEYDTEDRAKQVMKEIEDLLSIDKFSNVTDIEIDLAIKVRKLAKYEMPEK